MPNSQNPYSTPEETASVISCRRLTDNEQWLEDQLDRLSPERHEMGSAGNLIGLQKLAFELKTEIERLRALAESEQEPVAFRRVAKNGVAASQWFDMADPLIVEWSASPDIDLEYAYTHPAPSQQAVGVPEEVIKQAVNRFLGWKLPEDFYPDNFITHDRAKHNAWGGYPNSWPTGTNLLTADQAKAMFEHCLRKDGK